MKETKIFLQATIRSTPDKPLTEAHIRAALAELGSVESVEVYQSDLLPSKGLTKKVWVHISAQKDNPYFVVQGAFERSDVELSEYELQRLRSLGVCTKVSGEYPRADRYGAPLAASNKDAAAAIATLHLFAVASEGLEVDIVDEGGGGVEEYWLCIAMPKGTQ